MNRSCISSSKLILDQQRATTHQDVLEINFADSKTRALPTTAKFRINMLLNIPIAICTSWLQLIKCRQKTSLVSLDLSIFSRVGSGTDYRIGTCLVQKSCSFFCTLQEKMLQDTVHERIVQKHIVLMQSSYMFVGTFRRDGITEQVDFPNELCSSDIFNMAWEQSLIRVVGPNSTSKFDGSPKFGWGFCHPEFYCSWRENHRQHEASSGLPVIGVHPNRPHRSLFYYQMSP
jgi:hypothetical protein